MARRFSEAGIRFIQLNHAYSAPGVGRWDQHTNLKSGHEENAVRADKPIAGLLTDLKARGLLDDTLVWWGGEFGRTPTVQIPAHELLPFPALQTGQARLDCQRARPFLLELLEMQSSLRPQPPEEEWREILTVPALGRPSRHQQGPEERSFSFHSSRTKRQRGILRHPENTIRRSVS